MPESIIHTTPLEVAVAVISATFGERHPNPRIMRLLYSPKNLKFLTVDEYYRDLPNLDQVSQDVERSLHIIRSVEQILTDTRLSDYRKISTETMATFRLRFDIDNGLIRSYREVGRDAGVSHKKATDRVRIVFRALRHPGFSRQLKPFLESLYPVKNPS